jgi:serine/threonine-protein kinase
MDTDGDARDSQEATRPLDGERPSDLDSKSDAPTVVDVPLSDTEGAAATVPARSPMPTRGLPDFARSNLFLGKYEIERVIGSGGMGTVVLARHCELGARYAIKFMRSGELDRAAVDRFKREAKTGAMLDHPNVVRVFDCGEQDGRCYIVMEYVEGESLRRRLKRLGRYPVDDAIHFAGIVCNVLAMMHDRGITHRDQKPDNIIFQRRSCDEFVKILDFGIAKLASATSIGTLTAQGIVMGTPIYMSPEQCEAGDVDGRSDIYALGVILFEMLTGQPPFVAENHLATMYLHVNKPPPLAHTVDPRVPPRVSAVVRRMMAKSPADRYQSAASCAQALADASGVPIPLPIPKREISHAAIGYGVAGVLAASIVGAMLWGGLQKSADPRPATAPPAPASSAPPFVAEMLYIPGGTFVMGTNEGDLFDAPPHEVAVAPFYLDKTEVTNRQYAEFVRATGYEPPHDWVNKTYKVGTGDLPVVNVTWADARAYAEWAHKRLPTEAEWEYAARGTDGRKYPWGDEWIGGNAYTKESGLTTLQPAGSARRGASPFGVLDMSGNAWEWCDDNFSPYPGSTAEPKDTTYKIIRGGSLGDDMTKATTTYRNWVPPEQRFDALGFRCAKEIEPR